MPSSYVRIWEHDSLSITPAEDCLFIKWTPPAHPDVYAPAELCISREAALVLAKGIMGTLAPIGARVGKTAEQHLA